MCALLYLLSGQERKVTAASIGERLFTPTCREINIETARAKRHLPATTAYPASRLSSACSCILTATPDPSPVYASTDTIFQTTTKTTLSSCKDANVIVANGDFETGSLAPWTILSRDPDPKYYREYFSFNVTTPGRDSKYAFTMTDGAATTYVQVSIGQSVPVCPGQQYKLSAQVFITNGSNPGPLKEQYAEIAVDGITIASAPGSYILGPPVVWIPLSGIFTAKAGTAAVSIMFTATNLVAARWGVDDVVITRV
ncbi:MAG: hypothetical protein Q9186_005057 [Xanthomendoza sp. 1 TL-2023]